MPLVNIDLLAGRSDDEIDRISDCVHEAMTAELDERMGIRTEDVAIVLVENARQDWSFGRGDASYVVLPREAWR